MAHRGGRENGLAEGQRRVNAQAGAGQSNLMLVGKACRASGRLLLVGFGVVR
jgi:hypothetical protein